MCDWLCSNFGHAALLVVILAPYVVLVAKTIR